MTLKPNEIDYQTVEVPEWGTLYHADPNCQHDMRAKGWNEGGGIECRKCKGWFCY
jgi:hypothetical protein